MICYRTSTKRENTLQAPSSTVHLGSVDEEDHMPSEISGASSTVAQALARMRLSQSLKDDEPGDEGTQTHEWKRYDFALNIAVGPGIYHQTKACT